MGVKNLNNYLINNCSKKSIQKIHLSDLKGKTLVIDTSIYLYKYASENALMENMYLLISLFKNYLITPIFVFDGKPPDEKRELLYNRRMLKKTAENKYNEIKSKDELSSEDIKELNFLKKQFVYINNKDITEIKLLMDNYNVKYYDAVGEADQLCAYLTKTKKVSGCISDDMDMFIYGCNRIIRNISLMNHTCILYNTHQILKELNINFAIFKIIIIISGTDYNINTDQKNNTLYTVFEYYKKFLQETSKPNEMDFYNYMKTNSDLIPDDEKFQKIMKMFDITTYDSFSLQNNEKTSGKTFIYDNLKNFLKTYDFIFIHP